MPAGNLFLATLFLLIGTGISLAQTVPADQSGCIDPLTGSSTACRSTSGSQGQGTSGAQVAPSNPSSGDGQERSQDNQQIYVDSAGYNRQSRNPASSSFERDFPPDPPTDFQKLARSATGENLPIFGRDLFQRPPSTFAPADRIPVTSDYVVGPGDEVLVRLWGPETFNSQLTIDTTGSIYIPKVGAIHVAGLRYSELQNQINTAVSHIYRNFNLSVDLGHLRSIQVYVVGEARKPGAYTISALSTVLNALFESGGPAVQGSLRHIQLRRSDQPPVEFDLYDLLLHGDKANDMRLQQGDTIFIPHVGAQVALAGSVRHPAIYELRGDTNITELLQYAGGYTPTASLDHLSLERIDVDYNRKVLSLSSLEAPRTSLRDGDVLFINHISPGYEKSVTIRGNLANPGRFSWHPGMRLSEIIPDRMALLTNDYWRARNRLGVPVPLFEPILHPRSRRDYSNAQPNARQGNLAGQSSLPESIYIGDQDSQNLQDNNYLSRRGYEVPATADSSQQARSTQNNNAYSNPSSMASGGIVDGTPENPADSPRSGMDESGSRRSMLPQHRIEIPVPEINWSYAVIERLDPATLKNSLIPFNLGRLVQDHDATQDLELQAGDIVTILSEADIPVPLEQQTKYIRLEGEFTSAGVYSVKPNETLADVIRRAGGISSKAYLYGSSFLRESARVLQQQRLDEYISTLSTDMERAAAVRTASSSSGVTDPNALAQQRSLISQLRQLRATGRVILEFQPTSSGLDAIPAIPLENGDVFRIPPRPNTVSVIGAVYGQNVFLYNAERRVEDYVALAGNPNRIADRKHAFIIRADGSVFSRERAQGVWNNHFDSVRINPGDSIVIPEKLIKPSALRNLVDYSSIVSSFGLAAAALYVIR